MVKLCRSDAVLEGKCKAFCLDSGNIFIVRHNGQLYAYANRCPHLGVELNWQEDVFLDSEGEFIQCTTHGALFLIESGKCVAGPCVNQWLTQCKINEQNGSIFFQAP